MSNHEDSNAEIYRRQILALEDTIKLLKRNLLEESKLKYDAYKRIGELTSTRSSLNQN
jgi:hypothetical protein